LSPATVGPHTTDATDCEPQCGEFAPVTKAAIQPNSTEQRRKVSSIHVYCGSMNIWFCHILCSSVSKQLAKKKKNYITSKQCLVHF